MNRSRRAAARIQEHVSILQILVAYGYNVRADGGHREQQFSCDLHGSGLDQKPSARVYPESNSWYCFACDKTRDVIETVRVKEDLNFWPAVKKLETAAGLEPLPWTKERGDDIVSEVTRALEADRTFEQDEKRVCTLLDGLTMDRLLPRDELFTFWEGFDQVIYRVRGPRREGGDWSEQQGRVMLDGLRQRALDAVKDHQKGHENPSVHDPNQGLR